MLFVVGMGIGAGAYVVLHHVIPAFLINNCKILSA